MIRLYQSDNTAYKDFGNYIFSSNLCVFDFTLGKVTIAGVDYKIPKQDELTTSHSNITANGSITLEYYSVLFVNNGDGDVFINTTQLKSGNAIALGGYDKRIVQTFAITFSGGTVDRLDIVQEIAK